MAIHVIESVEDVMKWRHLPIGEVVIYYNDDPNEYVQIKEVEEGSKWSLTEIRSNKKDKKGNSKIIGLNFTANLKIVQNEYDHYVNMVAFMRNNANEIHDVKVWLIGVNGNNWEAGFRFSGGTDFKNFDTEVIQKDDTGTNFKFEININGRVHPTALVGSSP